MMARPLYLLLILSVLIFGCGTDDPQVDSPDSGPEARNSAPARPSAQPPPGSDRPAVVVLGNSIAAGYGLEPEEAFPSILQERIDDLGWDYEVVNAGLSGDTSAGGLRRIEWLLQRDLAVLVLELGGNDGLRGIPPEVTQNNLQGIIDRTRELHPDARIILAGMQIPPNMGAGYATRFAEIFPELARRNDIDLIPFVLEGVGGVRDLNLPDGIHPTARGQEIVADNVWEVLRPVLEEIRTAA
jgi:acyl-CoA thioesterase I